MNENKNNILTQFGFSLESSGVHTARTMMLEELNNLLSLIKNPDAVKTDYFKAITEENCLGKRSGITRMLTYRHLAKLYALDPSVMLFRTLLFFWQRDISGRPLLALLCAYARDAILRQSAPFILAFPQGATISRESLEQYLESKWPGRFSKATLTSTAQNINSTWTQSGHLSGRAHKVRSRAKPTPGTVSYALLFGYLTGIRGEELFKTNYAKLLDCNFIDATELTADASKRSWIVFKRVGEVIEVLFPALINTQEMEFIREQS